ERVADVILVAVREHDMGDALGGGRLVGHEGRIAGEERIDQHRRLAEVEAEGGMAIPGDLHGGSPMSNCYRAPFITAVIVRESGQSSTPFACGPGLPLSRAMTPRESW